MPQMFPIYMMVLMLLVLFVYGIFLIRLFWRRTAEKESMSFSIRTEPIFNQTW